MAQRPDDLQGAGRPLAVWDAVVRGSHALLAVLLLFNLLRDDGDLIHRVAGYAAAGVVVARWLWALRARGPASLAALRPSLRATTRYLRDGAPRHAGHDPLGLWMVWCLWGLVMLLALSGWMSRLDAFWGDEWLHQVHAVLADALWVAIALHLLGVAAMSWRWHENLPASMLSGRKRAGATADDTAAPATIGIGRRLPNGDWVQPPPR